MGSGSVTANLLCLFVWFIFQLGGSEYLNNLFHTLDKCVGVNTGWLSISANILGAICSFSF